MRLFIVIGIFQLSTVALALDQSCRNTGQIPLITENTEFWIEFTRHLAINAASTDLKGFCEWNRMDRSTSGAFWSNPDAVDDYRRLKESGDRDAAAQKLLENSPSMGDPIWSSSLLGHPLLKSKSHSLFTNVCGENPAMSCASQLAVELGRRDLLTNYQVPEYVQAKQIAVSEKELSGVCGYLQLSRFLGCKEAARDLLPMVNPGKKPSGGVDVTGIPLIQESFSDRSITKALGRVASRIWSRIGSKQFQSEDNIFTELVQEMQKDGISESTAKSKALKVLGAIGSGGPLFSARIESDSVHRFPDSCLEKSCNLNGVFMAAIGEGLVHADTIKMSSSPPSLYSLPPETNFPCDIGKSYHFWMSAAWTARLIEKGHSPGAARAATFAGHLGYQLRSEGIDTTRSKAFSPLTYPRFGSIENAARLDMSLAGAGTSFGANLAGQRKNRSVDVKAGFINTLEKATPAPASEWGSKPAMDPANTYDWLTRLGARTAYRPD